MFRATSIFICRKQFIYCHRFVDYNLVSIVKIPRRYAVKLPRRQLGPPRTREPCPPPPPPPPKPIKEDPLLWGTICALLIAGIGIVTAKSSPQIRDWLTLYAPYIDDLIAIIYEENMTHSEFVAKCIEDIKTYINKEPCPKDVALKEPVAEDKVVEEKKECPPVITDICTIEKCLDDVGEYVAINYSCATDACQYYNKLVDETMEGRINMNSFDELKEAKCDREKIIKEAIENATDGVNKLEEMTRYLDCGVTASKQEIENTKTKYRYFQSLHNAKCMEYRFNEEEAKARDSLVDMVQELVQNYADQIEALVPSYKYKAGKPFTGDADIVLFSTTRLVKKLQEDYDAIASAYDDRVSRAFESLSQDPKVVTARNLKINMTYTQKLAELAKMQKARFERQNSLNDQRLKKMINDQKNKHQKTLQQELEKTAKMAQESLDKQVEAKVALERRIMEVQRTDMQKRLSIVEEKYNARLKVERDTRRSQDLWAAGSSLIEATKGGSQETNDINKYLDMIEKSSTDDKLVQTVLKSIPAKVREEGIIPEPKLKESYKIMEDTAMKIALVEEDGAYMPVYALSWLQSFLLNWKIPGIPQCEYEHPPKEISDDLDTFDLLQRSRFWINQGNLARALPYVENLKGASRLAAQTWIDAARNNVEVRQAAEAIKAHATAMSLQYV